jgi:hypothetical protein
MPDIENSYKTQTILDMNLSQDSLEFINLVTKNIEPTTRKILKLILADRLEEARQKGGKSKENYLLKKYKAWIDLI